MRAFSGNDNIEAPSADYPKGRSKDRVGSTPGTTSNERLNGDMQQLFQKLVIDAQISENGLPDNVTNGYQLLEALVDKIQKTMGGILSKKIDIGTWDMTSTITTTVPHGLDSSKIVGFTSPIILDDSGNAYDANTDALISDGLTFKNTSNGYAYDSNNFYPSFVQGSSRWGQSKFSGTGNRGYFVVFYIP